MLSNNASSSTWKKPGESAPPPCVRRYAFEAEQKGFTLLRLGVGSENPARLLYQQAGFVCIGTGAQGYLRYERCLRSAIPTPLRR